MSALTRREYRLDPFDWVEHMMRPGGFLGTAMCGIRVENETREDAYILRAELPGVDPDKDVQISVANGILTIHAERREQTAAAKRSEFHYGEFTRSVALPTGTDPEQVVARYVDGILEVTVPITKPAETRTIPITRK